MEENKNDIDELVKSIDSSFEEMSLKDIVAAHENYFGADDISFDKDKTEEEKKEEKAKVLKDDGKIDKVYFCPQLKSVPDNYRKPSPKMAYFAQNDFPDIDLSKSIMIGDMNSDVEFGRNAGMKTIFIGDNELTITPDDRFETLYDFAKTL